MKLASLSVISRQFPAVEIDYLDLLAWRYLAGGRNSNGVDCLGLVLEIFRRAGLGLPDLKMGSALEFQGLWNQVSDADTLFDLVDYPGEGCHLGTVIRLGQVISVTERQGVGLHRINAIKRIKGVRFFRLKTEMLPDQAPPPMGAEETALSEDHSWIDAWATEIQEVQIP